MKANELRIGNTVRVCFQDVEGWEEVQVTDIHSDNTIDTTANATTKYYYEPIPLTPEILERCKDVSKSYYTYELCVKQDLMYITWHPRAGLNILVSHETEDKNITISGENLHDLQNLYYALTGTELTISHNNK